VTIASDASAPALQSPYDSSTAYFFQISANNVFENIQFVGSTCVTVAVDITAIPSYDSTQTYILLVYDPTSTTWISSSDSSLSCTGGSSSNLPLVANIGDFTFGADANTITGQFAVVEQPGGASGDPHLIGFLGQRYLIEGEPGHIYNLITTPSFQLNVRLEKSDGPHNFTIISEVGIRVGKDRIFTSEWAHLRLNDEPVGEVRSVTLSDGVSVLTRDVDRRNQGQTLTTPEFFLRMMPRGYEIDLKELRMLRKGSEEVHGLVGQSWKAEGWPKEAWKYELNDQTQLFQILEGVSVFAYEVVDGLFGVDFPFNRFQLS